MERHRQLGEETALRWNCVTEKQLESGVKIISQCYNKLFVFATFWPSWFFAARAHGFATSVSIHVEDMSADTEQILTEVIKESGSSLLTKEDWLQDLHLMMEKESESKLVVLLQGPDRTLEDLWQRFKQMSMEWKHKMCILEIITPKSGKREGGKCGTKRKYSCLGDREETVSTFEVSHEMVGGVIDHEWKARTNVFLERLEIQQLQRHTRVVAEATDYLSTTERGDIVPVPSKATRAEDKGSLEAKVDNTLREERVCLYGMGKETGHFKGVNADV